ncbi:MAG: M14 family zinc carboxypeptidase [Candidatus Cloacimonadales bacterium]
MKKMLIFLMLMLVGALSAQLYLDPAYHTNEEIEEELFQLQEQHSDIMKVEQIGETLGSPFQDPLPIWGVKISDNVQENEDEPALLFIGQVHAEEVLGVEITMNMIYDILENRNYTPYNVWISELEIWIVPTYNPEGLGVVMDTEHVSWRKNMRDNNENGEWDVELGVGRDIDGVDMNRNFSFNWVHGDTLYCPDGDELYDYYRGPAPISEGGIQAITNLAAEQHFIYSVAWHSSRTGNLSEQIFYSFEWDDLKRSPDFEHNQYIGEEVASRIQKETGSGFYEPSPSRGRKGSAHEWFYQEHGTTQLLIECGTQNLQPNEAIMLDTVERNLSGAFWLFSRILGYQADSGAMLTGHVTDAETGAPIVAEVIIEENHASFFTPRLTDDTFGRYWRQLNPGQYTLRVRKAGYQDHLQSVTVNNSSWTIRDVELQPLQPVNINVSTNTELDGVVEILGEYHQVIPFSGGDFSLDTFAGEQQFIVKIDGFVPYQYQAEHLQDADLELELAPEVVLFADNFDAGIPDWETEYSWAAEIDPVSNTQSLVVHRNFFQNSMHDFYPNNMDDSAQYSGYISLQGVADDVVLTFDHKYRTEHDVDFGKVEVSTNGTTWQTIAEYSGISKGWQDVMSPTNDNVVLSLADYVDTYLHLRFRFVSDDTQRDPGWWIDNLKIVSSLASNANEENIPELKTELRGNFPNPFNPETTIRFNLAEQDYAEAQLEIYNVRGQKIKSFDLQSTQLSASNSVVWDGRDQANRSVASGVYFYKLSTADYQASRKMILLK